MATQIIRRLGSGHNTKSGRTQIGYSNVLEMTPDEKANYLRIALALQKISVSTEIADRVCETLSVIEKKGGDFSVHDAVDIELRMDRKYAEKGLQNETPKEKPKANRHWLSADAEIKDISMSLRLYNGLMELGITKARQLDTIKRSDFFAVRGLSKKSWNELMEIIDGIDPRV